MFKEWHGDSSNKFLPSKLHTGAPVVNHEANDYHPYYSVKQKHHFEPAAATKEYQFRSSSRLVPDYLASYPAEPKLGGKKYISID